MSVAKRARIEKRQLGQFLTPLPIAQSIVDMLPIELGERVLEPSLGKGIFLLALRQKMLRKYPQETVYAWTQTHLEGCEVDATAYAQFAEAWGEGGIPQGCVHEDFFRYRMPTYERHRYFKEITPRYDWVIGNPPFGGTIDSTLQDALDAIYGMRHGRKIKKETYAFFIVKALDLLKTGGTLVFICSDTLLSIATMAGLRRYLMEICAVSVERLPGEFKETQQPMILLRLSKGGQGISLFGTPVTRTLVESTPNASWLITPSFARYFKGPIIGNYLIASSGMTVGKNKYFLREIHNGYIIEPYAFSIQQRPITLELRRTQARLGKLSESAKNHIIAQEAAGEMEPYLHVEPLKSPRPIPFPHPNYAPYNKATGALLYSPPVYAIYWENEGHAVYTFKKAGPWYLHGVGGKPFFKREGITWQLISSRLNTRYLPPGYILDSGAPCAFLRPKVPRNELFFIMAWSLTETCNRILKGVINHTRNIQSKDFERLPYPFWVSNTDKVSIVTYIKHLLQRAQQGEVFTAKSSDIRQLDDLFAFDSDVSSPSQKVPAEPQQLSFPF